jgi:hypothetical protein
MNDFFWILLCFYILMWGLGIHFLWKAYRLIIKNDLRYAKGPNGQPIKNRQKFAKKIAVTDVITGFSIIVLAVAIPLLTIKTHLWAPFVFIIGALRLSRLLSILKQDRSFTAVHTDSAPAARR